MLRRVQQMCVAMALGLLGVVPPPAADAAVDAAPSSARVAAATKTNCVTYDTHKACVVLHRSAQGRVWATGYLDKLSGNSNERMVNVYLITRACRATADRLRDDNGTQVKGDATATGQTSTIAWSNSLFYYAELIGSWDKVKRDSSGGLVYKGRKDIRLKTPTMSACPT